MNYSLIKAIINDTWNIAPEYFIQWFPVARSIVKGMEFSLEDEMKESIPFSVSASGYDSRSTGEPKPEEKVVAVTPLIGPMLKYDTPCGPKGTMTMAARLAKADQDESVIGHILFTDTGGGQSMSVNPMADAIKNLKKPIIGFVHGYMASAGVGVNVHCDEIYASNDHDIVGSVGTMIAFEAREIMKEDKDGYKEIRIYSDHSPDKNLEFEEAIKGNFKVIKERLLNPLDLKFMQAVRDHRQGIKDEHLTGKTYMAKDSIGVFVDGIKSFEEVVQRVYELAEEQNNSDNQSNSQSHNQNSSNMSKPKLERLAKAAGLESVEIHDNAISLSTDQAVAVESVLEGNETTIGAYSGLKDGESIQGLRDQIATLTSDKEQLTKDNATLTAEKEKLEKETVDETGAASENDGDQGEGNVTDPEAEHYYKLSQMK